MNTVVNNTGYTPDSPYHGPRFTPDELLIIWKYLTRMPTGENASIRRCIESYLKIDRA